MNLEISVEKIENCNYYSVRDTKGNSTMVFIWDDQMFVQTNNSPARYIEGVKRLSKAAKALVEYVKSIESDNYEPSV